jgi:hypothetical protein
MNKNERKRIHRREQKELRMILYPYFQTERDHDLLQDIEEFKEKEKEIMKNRPDWQFDQKFYSGNKWTNPVRYGNVLKDQDQALLDRAVASPDKRWKYTDNSYSGKYHDEEKKK